MALTVAPVPCLSDNYAWMLRAPDGTLAICDPGEAAPIAAAVDAAGGRLGLILLTHHHGDHIAGTAELVARYGAKVAGAAADAQRLPRLDIVLQPGGTVEFGGSSGHVIDTPGHTRGHIAIHFPDGRFVLCGDTLFSLGCGRLLEGNAEEMFGSLRRLGALPGDTLVCCGHEYTESNARFALTVEPENAALTARAAEVAAQRAAGQATVPTTIAQELAANPFMRATTAADLASIRTAKDNFR